MIRWGVGGVLLGMASGVALSRLALRTRLTDPAVRAKIIGKLVGEDVFVFANGTVDAEGLSPKGGVLHGVVKNSFVNLPDGRLK